MGRLRGKRNRDQDRYWTIQRRAEQSGMVGAVDAALCLNCRNAVAPSAMHKGWCLSCVAAWTDTLDPWLIAQSRDTLPAEVVPSPLVKQMDLVAAAVARPIPDETFLPLTQFMGRPLSVSGYRAVWNFFQAMYIFELETTKEAFSLGTFSPNTVHLCGRHAPLQRSTIASMLSRMNSAGDVFKLHLEDKHFLDYINGFVADNRLLVYDIRRTSVDVFTRFHNLKVWGVASTKDHFDHYCPVHWPFQSEKAPQVMPDVVMEIGALVPINMPGSLREDLCQDLVVAVLSGEATLEQLRGSIRYYIQQAFQHHPLRYGRLSLDHPPPHYEFKGEDYMTRGAALTDEDQNRLERALGHWSNTAGWPRDPDDHQGQWHHGRDRPKGLATVMEVSSHKHGGYAIDGEMNPSESDMDPEIAEVFDEEQHPRWRRKLSG